VIAGGSIVAGAPPGPPKRPAESTERGPAADRARPPRVLVVEDEYFIRVEIDAALRGAGYDVVGEATTADEAVNAAQAARPDIVIMDIRLASRRDGVDAAIELYRRFGMRCLFATAHADAETRRRAEEAKPLGWLSKPFTPESLVAAVKAALAGLGH